MKKNIGILLLMFLFASVIGACSGKTVVISFESNGGGFIPDQNIKAGTEIANAPVPPNPVIFLKAGL